MTDRSFTPISEYGLVGNLETCALVGPRGAVDWLPTPQLYSPSVFAALLDPERGGRFRVGPVGPADAERRYLEETNVLEATFGASSGTATLTDFMPVRGVSDDHRVLYRRLAGVDGTLDVEAEFAPRFDYARAETTVETVDGDVVARADDETAVRLETPDSVEFRRERRGTARASFPIAAGEERWFALRFGPDEPSGEPEETPATALRETVDYWRRWARPGASGSEPVVGGPWRDVAVRSGLALKLLTHRDSGAIAAAPTTSLPEEFGGVRNWDYRYAWLRDGAFTAQALVNLGHPEEADAYFDWVLDICRSVDPANVRPLYGLDGGTDLTEVTLDHLDGYRSSRPVRVGNEAAEQLQHDVYGELVLAVAEASRHGVEVSADDWASVRRIVDRAAEVWDRPDAGIWEVRCDPLHFVHSKVMCWAALDRGLAIAEETGFDAPLERWRGVREEIREAVLERGYDEERETFVRAFDEPEAIDATALLIPVVGFLPFDDERVENTVNAVRDRLKLDGGLVRRYDGRDGLPGEEGAFFLCSCWLVDALALSGRRAEARELFETLTGYVGPLGLVAEEVHPETKEYLGNYPQAFSHLGLVNSALYLDVADGYERPEPAPVGSEAAVDGVDADARTD